MLRDENSPRVTSVGTQNHIVVEKGHDTCSPTEHGINPGLVLHAVLSPFESFLDVHVPLLVVLVRQPKLQIFDLLCRLFWVLVLVRTVYFVRVFANLWEEAIVLFRITEDVKLAILLALNHVCEDFRQVNFDEVGNHVTLKTVAVCHSHHPVVLDPSEVVQTHE